MGIYAHRLDLQHLNNYLFCCAVVFKLSLKNIYFFGFNRTLH